MFDKIFGKKSENMTDNKTSNKNENGKELKKRARIAGFMYLGVIVFGIVAQVIRMGIIVPGDATLTANNIMANGTLFSGANVLWLISEMFFLLLGITLYVVLKPTNKNLATLMLVIIAVGVAIECLNTLNLFNAQHLLTSDYYTAVFTTEQLNAQAMLYIDSWEIGYRIAQIVSFGPWLIPAGYLMYKSNHFPNILGILVLLAGVGHLIECFQYFLLPDFAVISSPVVIIAVIGEFALAGWLLVKGVKVPEKKAVDNRSVGDKVKVTVS
jgi:hypothetical protein